MILGQLTGEDGGRGGGASPTSMIDLTPIVDMVFLLLIFFLAATTIQQQERELNVVLPRTQAAGPISAALREMVINVDAQGRTIVQGRVLDEGSLATLVADALDANPQQKVSVRGDRAVAYEHVARVLDVCRRAGVANPFLGTVDAGRGGRTLAESP